MVFNNRKNMYLTVCESLLVWHEISFLTNRALNSNQNQSGCAELFYLGLICY